MNWKPLPNSSRILPFRTACGGSNQPNLLDKLMMSRPTVAQVPASSTRSVEGHDAVLNGMTRSLQRRVSGLNLPVAMNTVIVQRRTA